MRILGIFAGFLEATVLGLIWLTTHMVVLAQLSAPEYVTGGYGGSVKVFCQYDIKFRENTKYWCKGPSYDLCEIIVKTPRNRANNKDSITDNKEEGVFTVTMNSLSKKDEDQYWCVISLVGRNIYTPVKLVVSPIVEPTPDNSSLGYEVPSWWATLRWILFILLLSCLVSTHIALWRMKSAKKICQHQQVQNHNSNIYEIEATI